MRSLLLLAMLPLVAGCSSNHLTSSAHLTVVEGALPAPSTSDIAPAPRLFVLAPRDFISVSVFGLPNLSLERIQVDNSGNIAVPLAGTVLANGKTPDALSREIEQRLQAAHVRNPHVAINILETQSQLVTVDGEVRTPGQYPVLGRMTLSEAVASAQGATQYAATDYVVIFRTIENRRYAALYNLETIRNGLADDPEVYSGDNILVGESRARRIFADVLAASPLLVTPIIALIQ